jgi:hypothetical protein
MSHSEPVTATMLSTGMISAAKAAGRLYRWEVTPTHTPGDYSIDDCTGGWDLHRWGRSETATSGGRNSWCNVADDGTMTIYDVPDPYDPQSQPIMGVPIKVLKKNGEELASSHYVRVPLELSSSGLRETGQRGMYTQHLKVSSSWCDVHMFTFTRMHVHASHSQVCPIVFQSSPVSLQSTLIKPIKPGRP